MSRLVFPKVPTDKPTFFPKVPQHLLKMSCNTLECPASDSCCNNKPNARLPGCCSTCKNWINQYNKVRIANLKRPLSQQRRWTKPDINKMKLYCIRCAAQTLNQLNRKIVAAEKACGTGKRGLCSSLKRDAGTIIRAYHERKSNCERVQKIGFDNQLA